jgi:hypothetical protein
MPRQIDSIAPDGAHSDGPSRGTQMTLSTAQSWVPSCHRPTVKSTESGWPLPPRVWCDLVLKPLDCARGLIRVFDPFFSSARLFVLRASAACWRARAAVPSTPASHRSIRRPRRAAWPAFGPANALGGRLAPPTHEPVTARSATHRSEGADRVRKLRSWIYTGRAL